jgi:hypothetical protein
MGDVAHLEQRVPHVVVLLAHLLESPPIASAAFAAAAGEGCAGLQHTNTGSPLHVDFLASRAT